MLWHLADPGGIAPPRVSQSFEIVKDSAKSTEFKCEPTHPAPIPPRPLYQALLLPLLTDDPGAAPCGPAWQEVPLLLGSMSLTSCPFNSSCLLICWPHHPWKTLKPTFENNKDATEDVSPVLLKPPSSHSLPSCHMSEPLCCSSDTPATVLTGFCC